jgi:hypothetical protein
MRRSLPVLAAGALAGAALLVPSTASAQTHSYWSTTHESQAHARIADPANDITWTILDHKIIVTTPDLVVVPMVYTCGTKADAQDVRYNPAAFQTVFEGASASAYIDSDDPTDYPTFTCDGSEHVSDVVLPGQEGTGFENGNIEVGLVKADLDVNATPESTQPGSKITVKGTVKRDGKAYKDKAATLYFQSKAGAPAAEVGSAVASSKGNLTTKVTVSGPGTYFWTTTSTSKTQAGASLGDYAAAA